MAKIEHIHNPNRRRWLLLGGLVLLILIGALVYFVFLAPDERPFAVPGSLASAETSAYSVNREVVSGIAGRLKANLETTPGLLAWYQQENRELAMPAAKSSLLDASEQIYYAIWLVEQGDKPAFKAWLSSFQANFISPDGQVYESRSLEEAAAATPASQPQLQAPDPATTSWPDTLLYVRALAMAYARWPQNDFDRAERAGVDNLGRVIGDRLVADSKTVIPTPAPTVDPGATPTPRPTATPTPDPVAPTEQIIQLHSLDLLTLKNIAVLDPRFQARYDEALSLVEGGLISDVLPLYATSYYPKNSGYVRFEGTTPVIDLESSLLVALHLAEVGRLDPRTLSWLGEHLLNDSALFTTYHIAQGQATSSEESLVGYALTARIARITGQEALYRKATDRLQWHLATSLTSQVRGAVFRQTENGVVSMTASDNIWALLALS